MTSPSPAPAQQTLAKIPKRIRLRQEGSQPNSFMVYDADTNEPLNWVFSVDIRIGRNRAIASVVMSIPYRTTLDAQQEDAGCLSEQGITVVDVAYPLEDVDWVLGRKGE